MIYFHLSSIEYHAIEGGSGVEVYTQVFFSKLDVGLCEHSASCSGCPVPDERARCPLRGRVGHKNR